MSFRNSSATFTSYCGGLRWWSWSPLCRCLGESAFSRFMFFSFISSGVTYTLSTGILNLDSVHRIGQILMMNAFLSEKMKKGDFTIQFWIESIAIESKSHFHDEIDDPGVRFWVESPIRSNDCWLDYANTKVIWSDVTCLSTAAIIFDWSVVTLLWPPVSVEFPYDRPEIMINDTMIIGYLYNFYEWWPAAFLARFTDYL